MQSAEKPNLVRVVINWLMHQIASYHVQRLIGPTLVAYNIIGVKKRKTRYKRKRKRGDRKVLLRLLFKSKRRRTRSQVKLFTNYVGHRIMRTTIHMLV